jgi:uncharacterized protein (DUF3820 family)
MTTINTHNLICDFGKHKGEPYTRLPVGYLTWMVNSNHSRADIAEAELKRRGTVMPELDISGHAIDRASLNCRKIWHQSRGENEGLHAWLQRICKEALEKKDIDDKGRYLWGDVQLVFEMDGRWPVLKTIMPRKNKQSGIPVSQQDSK